jgi:oligoendopeptidase F
MPTRDTLPRWDLSPLFSGTNDPKIRKHLDGTAKRVAGFASDYRGAIAKTSEDPQRFREMLETYEALIEDLTKIAVFAQMRHDTDTGSHEAAAFRQKIDLEVQKLQQELVFFDVELARLETGVLADLEDAPELAPYRHFLTTTAKWRPHVLGETEEKILIEASLTGREAFAKLFDTSEGRARYRINGKELNLSQALSILHDPSAKARATAAAGLTAGFERDAWLSASIYNTIIQDKRLSDMRRGFADAEASRHLSNKVDRETVDALVAATEASFGLVQRYYRLKKKLLKAGTLRHWDRYAPIGKSKKTYRFGEAKEMVLDAFGRFHPTFEKEARPFFDEHRIDAPAANGKRGGAYCMFVSPADPPFVLLNYTGSANDVLTMAHELGHGIHASLARKQTALNYHTPITMAETASIFAETVVFHDLADTLTSKTDRIALYAHKIESIFASVHRQMAMFGFEREAFRLHAEHGEVSTEQFAKLWLTGQKKMFGSSVKITDDYGAWWSYISHFIHTPFYVYAYAFGELLTLAVMAQVEAKGSAAKDAYIQMLQLGGSQAPDDLLSPLGIDIRAPGFWKGGIRLVENFLEELEMMARTR